MDFPAWVRGIILLCGFGLFEHSRSFAMSATETAADSVSLQGTAIMPVTSGNEDAFAMSSDDVFFRDVGTDSLLQKGTNTRTTDVTIILKEEHTVVNTMEDQSFGWSWHPVTWSWWTIMQLISAIFGILGNGLVILVLFQRRKKSRSTDTLVSALAVADFLTSIVIIPVPQAATVPSTWLGEIYCRILPLNALMWIFVLGSVYTLVAISIERYIAVIHPIYFNRVITRRSVSIAIVFIWVFTILCSLFGPFVFKVEGGRCILEHPIPEGYYIAGAFLFILRLLLPTITMLVTQLIIARELHRQSLHFKQQNDSSFHSIARRRIIKTMAIVIIIYVVCWSPSQITFILFNFGLLPRSYRGSSLYYFFNILGFFNSCMNPIIYAARFKEFRVAVKQMITCSSGSRAPIFEQETGSTRDLQREKPSETGNASTKA